MNTIEHENLLYSFDSKLTMYASRESSVGQTPYQELYSRREAIGKIGRFSVGLALTSLVATCSEKKEEWQDFTSQNYPYRMHYPREWFVRSISGADKIDLFFPNSRDIQRTIISIEAEERDPEMTLSQAAQKVIESSKDDFVPLGISAEFAIISEPSIKDPQGFNQIAGQFDAYRIQVRLPQARPPREQQSVVFFAGDYVWYTLLTAYDSEVEKQLPTFKKMLDSFQLRGDSSV